MELEDIVEILKKDPEKAVPELLEDVRKQYGEVPLYYELHERPSGNFHPENTL